MSGSGAVLGPALLIVAVVWALRSMATKARSARAIGEVVQIRAEQKRDSDTKRLNTAYRPIIRFTDAAGRPFTIESRVSTSHPRESVGDKATIAYEPENPQGGRVDSFASWWLGPSLIGAAGALAFLISLAR